MKIAKNFVILFHEMALMAAFRENRTGIPIFYVFKEVRDHI